MSDECRAKMAATIAEVSTGEIIYLAEIIVQWLRIYEWRFNIEMYVYWLSKWSGIQFMKGFLVNL